MSEENKSQNKEHSQSTQTTQHKQKHTRTWSSTKVLDFIAYFAVICIALALIFRLIFKNNFTDVSNAFRMVGECLAYIICIWLGLYWALRKRGSGWNSKNLWWLIIWIVATVVIVVVYLCGNII